jgi:hypothetical protein
VTRDALEDAVRTYAAGLEAELTLLGQLQRLATAQREATNTNELDRMTKIGEERERVLASLVAIEHEIRSIRTLLADTREQVAALDGFARVVALHRTAGSLVQAIVSSDEETMQALREAELARRLTAAAIELGDNTLAAYRRVIAPPLTAASLLDRHG